MSWKLIGALKSNNLLLLGLAMQVLKNIQGNNLRSS